MTSNAMQSRHTVYRGEFVEGGVDIYVLDEKTGYRSHLTHVKKHSEIMEWHGAGRADLAHSILCHHLEVDAVSQNLYLAFKSQVVHKFPQYRWQVTRAFINNWLAKRWDQAGETQVREDLHG